MGNYEREASMDLHGLMAVINKRKWIVILIPILLAALSAIVSIYILKPVYESRISIVIGKDMEQLESEKYEYTDIMMYQNLVKTYAAIAESRAVSEGAAMLGGSPSITAAAVEIRGNTRAIPQASTQIMEIRYRNGDKYKAKAILDNIATAFVEQAMRIYPSGNIQVIDEAVVPSLPASPNIKRNVLIALLGGILLGVGLALLREQIDGSLKSQREAENYLDMPVIGVIPRRG